MSTTLDQARSAKAVAQRRLAALPNVVGIGISRIDNEDFAVKVNLSEPIAGQVLPADIDGVPLKVEVVGVIKAR